MSKAQIASVEGEFKPRLMTIVVILGLLLMFDTNIASACDTDAECGEGGTCIKREKRARGVCYGGRLGPATEPMETFELAAEPTSVTPAENVSNASHTDGDVPIYGEEGYVEPTAPARRIDRLDIPDRTDSTCVTSTDCSGGQECVYRDPMLGHGECEAPPTR